MEAVYDYCRHLLHEGKFGDVATVEQFIDDAELSVVQHELLKTSTIKLIPELAEMVNAIERYCTGDGCGLRRGGYVDEVLSELFTKNVSKLKQYHKNDADCKINGVPLSLKVSTSTTGTSFALSWSKNTTVDNTNNFLSHVMVIIAHSSQWYKNKEGYCDTIHSGIYLISKRWCKDNIVLGKNNKSDKFVSKESVYRMLRASKHFIPMPEPKGTLEFNLLKAFCQESETEHTAQSS